jgi:hypothetical protein
MRIKKAPILAGLSVAFLAGCGVEDGATALEKITSDPEYRALAADGAAEGWFKNMSDTQAFAKAKDLGSHASLVAFQEVYGDSPLVAEADKEIARFRAFTATETTFVPGETLTAEWCWANRGRMGRWSNRMGGMQAGSGTRFGDLIFWTDTGVVQMVGGGYRGAEGGIEVIEGTSFIYQAECDGSDE